MEFLLLWIDDLDDAIGTLRHLAPKIVGFLCAVLLFAATGFALIAIPHVTLPALALVGSIALLEIARRRVRAMAQRDQR
jgi:hypothetical protein